MYANATLLSCGNCGGKQFEVAALPAKLLVQCVKCKSITEVVPSEPALEFEWGEGAEGILAPSSAVSST